MLRFNDGVEINTSGPLRTIRLDDGFYVVGEGFCIPVNDLMEAHEIATKIRKQTNLRTYK